MEDRIVVDPNVCHGKPVIRGTRTPVAIIVGSLAGGMSFEEVQREYDLTVEDIRAALRFASELVDQEQHRPAKPRKPGAWKGRIVIAADFDAPLPEGLLAAFRGAGR